MIRAAAAMLCLAACAPAGAEAVAPGIYGNVALSAVTGDLGGIELALVGTGAQARAEFVLCEGWCNGVHVAPVQPTEDGFAFHYAERYTAGDGNPAPSERFEVKAVRAGTGLRVTVTPAGNPEASFSADLPRIEQRFGLAVAAGN